MQAGVPSHTTTVVSPPGSATTAFNTTTATTTATHSTLQRSRTLPKATQKPVDEQAILHVDPEVMRSDMNLVGSLWDEWLVGGWRTWNHICVSMSCRNVCVCVCVCVRVPAFVRARVKIRNLSLETEKLMQQRLQIKDVGPFVVSLPVK